MEAGLKELPRSPVGLEPDSSTFAGLQDQWWVQILVLPPDRFLRKFFGLCALSPSAGRETSRP